MGYIAILFLLNCKSRDYKTSRDYCLCSNLIVSRRDFFYKKDKKSIAREEEVR